SEISNRGKPEFTLRSSLDGVETWNVYVGSHLMVLGVDQSGTVQSGLVFVMLGPKRSLSAIACATRTVSSADCSAIANSVAKDLGGQTAAASSAKPTAVHVLDV